MAKCKKCQNYGFFYIFWDILDKRKSNLVSRMCRIRAFKLPSQNWNNFL